MRPRRSKSSWRLPVVVIAALLALSLIAPEVEARLRSPWAFGGSGSSPLTGAWSGVVVTPTGARLGVAFDLAREPPDGGVGQRGPPRRGWGRFVGRAVACLPGGRLATYAIQGAPLDRRARRLDFHAAPDPAADGLTLSWFRLAWPGGDELSGEVDLHWRQGPAAISGPDHPDTVGGGRLTGRRLDGPISGSAACLARAA